MPEIRFDVVSGHFAVIATERVKRPSDYRAGRMDAEAVRGTDPECPFCPGNERLTPPEIYALRNGTVPDGPGWRVRVVPNKFPALVDPKAVAPGQDVRVPSFPDHAPEEPATAIYWMGPGVGAHEVVIETTSHAATLGSYSPGHLREVLEVLRDRCLILYDEGHVKYVQVFKNQGRHGGASLSHPHFQIVGLPVLPTTVAREGIRQRDYQTATGRCLMCDLVERELEKGARVVTAGNDMVVLTPFGSRYSFETLVLPRRHTSSLLDAGPEEMTALSGALVDLFGRYESLFPSLPYNMVLHSVPQAALQKRKWPYHAHIHVYPRLTQEAGLELGAGIHINPSPPETVAEQLRSVGGRP